MLADLVIKIVVTVFTDFRRDTSLQSSWQHASKKPLLLLKITQERI